jgi:MoxR-like ATPase
MLGGDAPEQVLSRGALRQVVGSEELAGLQAGLQTITVREEIIGYILDIVRASRRHHAVTLGAGPRATQALLLGARAYAAVAGRDFVTPDDIKSLVRPVLGHRLILHPEYEIQGTTVAEVLESLLQEIAVPR